MSGYQKSREYQFFTDFYAKAKESEQLPWHHQQPTRFIQPIHEARGKPGVAVDLGCGGGIDAVGMAELGWDVTGLDFMQDAIDFTQARAAEHGVEVKTVLGDVLEWQPGRQFDLIVDSGLMHNMDREKLRHYRARLLEWLAPGGDITIAHWESLGDHDRLYGGPRRITRQQLEDFFAPDLEVIKYDRMHATGIPESSGVGTEMACGFYWLRRPGD